MRPSWYPPASAPSNRVGTVTSSGDTTGNVVASLPYWSFRLPWVHFTAPLAGSRPSTLWLCVSVTTTTPGSGITTSSRDSGRCHGWRSEEHTSELQSQSNLVCRLLLEKKKKIQVTTRRHSNSS